MCFGKFVSKCGGVTSQTLGGEFLQKREGTNTCGKNLILFFPLFPIFLAFTWEQNQQNLDVYFLVIFGNISGDNLVLFFFPTEILLL